MELVARRGDVVEQLCREAKALAAAAVGTEAAAAVLREVAGPEGRELLRAARTTCLDELGVAENQSLVRTAVRLLNAAAAPGDA